MAYHISNIGTKYSPFSLISKSFLGLGALWTPCKLMILLTYVTIILNQKGVITAKSKCYHIIKQVSTSLVLMHMPTNFKGYINFTVSGGVRYPFCRANVYTPTYAHTHITSPDAKVQWTRKSSTPCVPIATVNSCMIRDIAVYIISFNSQP